VCSGSCWRMIISEWFHEEVFVHAHHYVFRYELQCYLFTVLLPAAVVLARRAVGFDDTIV
jgi:hypothetical protein